MPLWSNAANTVDAPKWQVLGGIGSSETGNTVLGNTTVGAYANNETAGLFGISASNVTHNAITTPGWNMAFHGSGPVLAVTCGNGIFTNGSTFVVTQTGATSATGNLTTNATGNLATGTITFGGAGFTNISSLTVAFNREKYIANVTVTGTTAAFTNSDYIICSNGLVNAVANVSTNATGGITNADFTITTKGLFPNTFGNSNVVVTAFASNGAASNGTGATFTVKVAASTGGVVNVTALGGRANRVTFEPLVALHMSNSSPSLPGA
jgi:hypothetical protein